MALQQCNRYRKMNFWKNSINNLHLLLLFIGWALHVPVEVVAIQRVNVLELISSTPADEFNIIKYHQVYNKPNSMKTGSELRDNLVQSILQ